MKIRAWWEKSSGPAKTITVLATILLLQIGFCALTPYATPWIAAVFDAPLGNDPFETLGYMAFEAILCFATLVAMFFVWVAMGSKRKR